MLYIINIIRHGIHDFCIYTIYVICLSFMFVQKKKEIKTVLHMCVILN